MPVNEKYASVSKISGKRINGQQGSVLIYIMAVLVIAGLLGVGMVSMTTTSAYTELGYNPSDNARFLARSGMDYAKSKMLSEPDYPVVRTLLLDEGEIEIVVANDPDQSTLFGITSVGTVFKDTPREARFELAAIYQGLPDGAVIIVDEDGNETIQDFNNVINTTDEDPDWVELIITSGVGEQDYDEFDFYAPEGITIEDGVEFYSDSAQGSINLEADTGDIVIEEGVVFSTDGSANNETEEIYIKTCGNIDIQGVDLTAQRYIYLEAGKNIYAQGANLTVTSNSKQRGINFVLADCDDPDFDGNIEIENLFINFEKSKEAEADPCGSLIGTLRAGSDSFNCN